MTYVGEVREAADEIVHSRMTEGKPWRYKVDEQNLTESQKTQMKERNKQHHWPKTKQARWAGKELWFASIDLLS